jgi:hypothetical protein
MQYVKSPHTKITLNVYGMKQRSSVRSADFTANNPSSRHGLFQAGFDGQIMFSVWNYWD